MNWIKKLFNQLFASNKDPFYQQIQTIIGVQPTNIALYRLAFKHKSRHKENNERLEFLGDSILDAVISEIIYTHFPQKNEGELSKLRSKLVSRNMLNKLGNQLGLLSILSYRKTHTSQGLQNTEGNALEALVGAIYLDKGYSQAKDFVANKLIRAHIDWSKLEKVILDYKSLVYTHCQKENKKLNFLCIKEDMENESNRFHIILTIEDQQVAEAFGKSKKTAEQKAAKIFLKTIS